MARKRGRRDGMEEEMAEGEKEMAEGEEEIAGGRRGKQNGKWIRSKESGVSCRN